MSQVASSSVPSGSGLSVREGINAVLGALMSQNSGPSAPPNPIPFMVWGDTATNEVMIRNPSNTAWVRLSEQMGAVEYDRAVTLTPAQQEQARANIGVGALANLNIVPVNAGGTGAQDPAGARANLGIGTLATINLNGDRGVVITGAGGHGFRELIADYLGVNEIGSVCFATTSAGQLGPGQLVSGGSLRPSGTQSDGNGGSVAMALGGNGFFTGTWMCMGFAAGVPGSKEGASLFRKVGN